MTEVLPYEVTVRVGENQERDHCSRGLGLDEEGISHGSASARRYCVCANSARGSWGRRRSSKIAANPADRLPRQTDGNLLVRHAGTRQRRTGCIDGGGQSQRRHPCAGRRHATSICRNMIVPLRRNAKPAHPSKPMTTLRQWRDGYKPDSMILDGPTTFRTASGLYIPHDYEHRWLGNITLTRAFADSLNIPALKLADHVGIHKVIATAHRFGVTTDIPAFLPIALGAAEISLYEQVAAYSSFPNDGIRLTPHFVHRVTTAEGEVLWDDAPDVHVSTDEKTARQMMQLFEAVTRQGTGRRRASCIIRWEAKPAPRMTLRTPGSLDFLLPSPVAYGLAMMTGRPWATSKLERRVALPIWMIFMRTAIADHPDEAFPGEAPQLRPQRSLPSV